MPDSFGARLRLERERRRITLEQLAASTKIKASLFDALEHDGAELGGAQEDRPHYC